MDRPFVVDEAHFIKNLTSHRSLVLVPILRRARRAILVSSTVKLPVELFNMLSIVRPDVFKDPFPFFERYCGA